MQPEYANSLISGTFIKLTYMFSLNYCRMVEQAIQAQEGCSQTTSLKPVLLEFTLATIERIEFDLLKQYKGAP